MLNINIIHYRRFCGDFKPMALYSTFWTEYLEVLMIFLLLLLSHYLAPPDLTHCISQNIVFVFIIVFVPLNVMWDLMHYSQYHRILFCLFLRFVLHLSCHCSIPVECFHFLLPEVLKVIFWCCSYMQIVYLYNVFIYWL